MSENNQGETCAACDPKTHISAEVKAMFKEALEPVELSNKQSIRFKL